MEEKTHKINEYLMNCKIRTAKDRCRIVTAYHFCISYESVQSGMPCENKLVAVTTELL